MLHFLSAFRFHFALCKHNTNCEAKHSENNRAVELFLKLYSRSELFHLFMTTFVFCSGFDFALDSVKRKNSVAQ